MQGLPLVSGKEIIKYLCKSKGFMTSGSRGSHVKLKSTDGKRMVSVPLHEELDRGTLSGILARVGIETDEFIVEWGRK